MEGDISLSLSLSLSLTYGNSLYSSTFPGGRVATAIVNATAPSPRIRLRIVDREGNDINGARLGEELYLRLDLDDDSEC